jgi:iron complex transport system substrate-binding protein
MKVFEKMLAFFLAVVLCVSTITVLTSCGDGDDGDEEITVTDMLGETQVIKKNPTKVACASRTTYDLLVAFGLGDCIDGVYYSLLENEWSGVFDEDAGDRYSLVYEESYETYIARGVELVFSPEKYITDGLREHGIAALNVSLYGNPNFDGYVYFFADLVKQIWDSEDVARRVDAWKAEMESTTLAIQSELAQHNVPARSIYYVRGDKNKGIGYTETVGSFTEYAYRLLGMNPLHGQFENNKPSAEEICAQNPDVFVVGGVYQKTLLEQLTSTEPYKNLDAVKNGQYYNIPIGLTMFEQLCVFSPAFLMDQANKLYPEYFDFDVEGEIKKLAKDFFGVEITDAEVANMLNGLSRNGESLEK